MDDRKPTQKQNPTFMREIRCPIHNRLIGRYDARDGLINATFYCPKCGREYTFTINRERNLVINCENGLTLHQEMSIMKITK